MVDTSKIKWYLENGKYSYCEPENYIICIAHPEHNLNSIVHEINEIVISGTSSLEVCASPLTANAHPHHDEKNSTRIHEKTTDTQHFGVLQLKLSEGKSSALRVGLYNSNGTAIFSHRETL